mmetsp:Transcript_45578/g.71415  ORF Transcript_45578/g.71415 Transcript_45578/m.71415 type:complete len:301 (-) Transcript_45578:87-989(-)
MSEEIQYLDDEITQICESVQKELDTVAKPKSKLKRPQKIEKVEELLLEATRGRNIYSNFRVELREVLKEKGRMTYTEWETKGHEHHKKIMALLQDLEALKSRLEQEPLAPGEKDKKDMNTWSANEIIEEGKKVQQSSNISLARSQKLVDQAEQIATETNVALKNQTEQMKSTNADIQSVHQGLKRADRILYQIAKRLATDKMIMCMVLVLILMILGLAVAKGAGWLDGGSDEEQIDCSFDFTQTTRECREQQAAEAAAQAQVSTPSPPTRRMLIKSSQALLQSQEPGPSGPTPRASGQLR